MNYFDFRSQCVCLFFAASSYDLRYSEDRDQLKTDFANAIRIEEADLAEGKYIYEKTGYKNTDHVLHGIGEDSNNFQGSHRVTIFSYLKYTSVADIMHHNFLTDSCLQYFY